MQPMQPIPSTSEALKRLERLGATEVQDGLEVIGRQVEDIAPECVGLSLSLVDDGLTFTLAGAGLQTLSLDAIQYLDGGPCVQAVADNQVIEVDTSALSEERWSMYARATAVQGVQSSVSMPLLDGERVVGGVNLYGGTPHAFEGCIDEIATVVGGWAPAAVRDADLTFSSQLRAAEAPKILARQADVDMATGLIAASQGIDTRAAALRLREAAERAGIAAVELARTVIRIHTEGSDVAGSDVAGSGVTGSESSAEH
jgi:GAF domain-containing protein